MPYSESPPRETKMRSHHGRRVPCKTLTHRGVTATIGEWARRLGISDAVIRGRLDRGWSVERALETPHARGGPRRRSAYGRLLTQRMRERDDDRAA